MKDGERSELFSSNFQMAKNYYGDNEITFFYLNTGDEMARVEMPSWASSKQQNVEIRGLGTFKIKKQRARIGRNPKNGSRIEIPAKNTIQWKMSKQLFKLLNNESNNNK